MTFCEVDFFSVLRSSSLYIYKIELRYKTHTLTSTWPKCISKSIIIEKVIMLAPP